jgi:hypothetical protein
MHCCVCIMWNEMMAYFELRVCPCFVLSCLMLQSRTFVVLGHDRWLPRICQQTDHICGCLVWLAQPCKHFRVQHAPPLRQLAPFFMTGRVSTDTQLPHFRGREAKQHRQIGAAKNRGVKKEQMNGDAPGNLRMVLHANVSCLLQSSCSRRYVTPALESGATSCSWTDAEMRRLPRGVEASAALFMSSAMPAPGR